MTEGAYLMERIKAKTIECGDCLIWQGYCNRGTTPVININKVPTAVRRLVYLNEKGPVHPGWEVVGTCESPKCVSAEHMKQVTMADRRREMSRKRNSRQSLRAVQKMRTNHAKLTMEKAREIRASDEPTMLLAQRYGVSGTLIGYVRSGRSWAEPSPWNGLGERRA